MIHYLRKNKKEKAPQRSYSDGVEMEDTLPMVTRPTIETRKNIIRRLSVDIQSSGSDSSCNTSPRESNSSMFYPIVWTNEELYTVMNVWGLNNVSNEYQKMGITVKHILNGNYTSVYPKAKEQKSTLDLFILEIKRAHKYTPRTVEDLLSDIPYDEWEMKEIRLWFGIVNCRYVFQLFCESNKSLRSFEISSNELLVLGKRKRFEKIRKELFQRIEIN